MPDLLLRDDAGVMPAARLERTLQLLAAARLRDLRLYGVASQTDLGWIAALLSRHRLRATAVCAPGDPLSEMAPLWESGCGLCLALSADERTEPVSMPSSARRRELFLPLARPDFDIAWLGSWLEANPGLARVRIGVSWTSTLSGPLPMRAVDLSRWADVVEQAVAALGRRGLETELACGVPLCLFSRAALGRLATQRIVWPIATCPTALLIRADGTVEPCPRLRAPRRSRIDRLETLREVTEACEAWLRPYRGLCVRAEGLRCRSAIAQACGLGCLEHDLGGWREGAQERLA